MCFFKKNLRHFFTSQIQNLKQSFSHESQKKGVFGGYRNAKVDSDFGVLFRSSKALIMLN